MTVLRSWRAAARIEHAHEYPNHFMAGVLPQLRTYPGFRGARLLSRIVGTEVEFVVQTMWESMTSIEAFAGPVTDRAVVEPDARAALTAFDQTVVHFDVLVDVTSQPS